MLAGEKNRSAENLKLCKFLHFFLLEYLDDNRHLNCWARALRFWRTESLTKIKKIYQSSDSRAFLLACVYGFNEVVRITLSQNLDQSVKEQGAMVAFSKGHASIADLLIGSKGDPKLREYVLHHMGDISEFHRLSDPGLVRWLVNFFTPAQITEEVIIKTMKLNHPETVGILLDHNSNLLITEEMILKSLINPQLVTALLAREPNISSTSEILMTAISFQSMDTDLINLIRRSNPVVITCDVISRAAQGAGFIEQQEQAIPILLLLLKRAGHIPVTEWAVSQAFEWDCTGEVTSILLDHGWPVTSVTSLIVLQAAKRGKAAVFPRILEAAGGSCQITPELLLAASGNFSKDGKEILKYLTSQLNPPVNDETWAGMIARCHRTDSLQIILDMKPHVQVPESALLSIAADLWFFAEHFSMLLSDGRELHITDAVVREVLEKLSPVDVSPEEIASQLLDRHGTKLVTEHMLISAASNQRVAGEVTRAIINRKLPVEVPSAEVIDAAIKNTSSGLQALQVFEEYLGPLEYTDKHVESVVERGDPMMKIVFDRRSITKAPLSMLSKAACRGNLDGMKFLLQLNNTIVTREILIAAASNKLHGAEMLRLLWDHSPEIELCIEMFMQAVGSSVCRNFSSDTISFLVDRLDDVKLGQQVLEAATTKENLGSNGCRVLVGELLDSTLPVRVTSEMAARIRKYDRCGMWDELGPYAMAMETRETADT